MFYTFNELKIIISLSRKFICQTLLLILFSTYMSILLVDYASAEVKCACPSIQAEGEGNSSCSANESGGRCTIDYNLFGKRELQAADILSKRLNLDFFPFPEEDTENSLVIAEEKGHLFSQIVLYLNVAAVSQSIRYSNTVESDNFSQIKNILDQNNDAIIRAFSSSTADLIISNSPDTQDLINMVVSDEIVISAGCVEVIVNDQWVMFKTYWSASRSKLRCRL